MPIYRLSHTDAPSSITHTGAGWVGLNLTDIFDDSEYLPPPGWAIGQAGKKL